MRGRSHSRRCGQGLASGSASAEEVPCPTDGWNILGIVIELDVVTMLGRAPPTLFAAAGETVTAGKFPLRLERFGRVFAKNQLLGAYWVDAVNRDVDLREIYDQEDPFQLAPYYLGAYRARLNANLAVLNGIEGKIDCPLTAGWDASADRAVPRRLPGRRRRETVRRGQLPRDRTGAAAGPRPHDLRRPLAQRRRGRHESHVRRHRRERPAHQRRRRPGDRTSARQLPLLGAAESQAGRRRQGLAALQAR